MTPEHAFLDSIWEDLDDDTTKLIFADWLEDQDDWRSSLLRWQVDRNRYGFWTPQFQSLQGLITRELLTRGQEWLAPLNRYSIRYSDGTGLLWLKMPARNLLKLAEPRVSEGVHRWITEVTPEASYLADILNVLEQGPQVRIFLNFSRTRFGDQYRRLARTRGLERVRSLDLTYCNFAAGDLRQLAESSGLGNLQYLFLGYSQGVAHELGALCSVNQFRQLRGLDLARCGLVDRHLIDLARAPLLGGLTALYLEDNQFSETGIEALLASPFLLNLRVLNLSKCGIPVQGLPAEKLRQRFPFVTL